MYVYPLCILYTIYTLYVQIKQLAKKEGVDAVWPGWGHASENPALPRRLTDAGIKFIGPTSPVMAVLGDKIAANILAQTAKVTCLVVVTRHLCGISNLLVK
jgi:biotin carboxylase